MKNKIARMLFAMCVVTLPAAFVKAQEPDRPAGPLDAAGIIEKSQEAFFYPGGDFKAKVTMRLISRSGQTRVRELTMLRRNQGAAGGEQKFFMIFSRPADVKDMTFMVHKHPDGDDDRWLFVPAIAMVRRIAAQDKRSSFVGSDFTYEDVSGRDIGDDAYTWVKEENLGKNDCAVIRSSPKAAGGDYATKLSWIDKTSFLPLKEEYYDAKGTLVKVYTADAVEVIKGFPTVVKRTMKDLPSGHTTEVTFTHVDYDIGLEDNLFSERYLRQPPRKWTE
jgi:outer membrane lipoprotein-sorting protein